MRVDLNKAMLGLHRLQIVKLQGARGARVTCREGTLWVTQEGFRRDDFLAPGCAITVETGGAVLIEALTESAVIVEGYGGETVAPAIAVVSA